VALAFHLQKGGFTGCRAEQDKSSGNENRRGAPAINSGTPQAIEKENFLRPLQI
jgi:hypothetical protein